MSSAHCQADVGRQKQRKAWGEVAYRRSMVVGQGRRPRGEAFRSLQSSWNQLGLKALEDPSGAREFVHEVRRVMVEEHTSLGMS